MKLYGGIDLHSNNSVVALLDEDERLVYRKRLANDAPSILEALAPYREAIVGLVVESTYNWYWLVDALMEAGYPVHLANTAALVQYSGLKYSDDDSDARWLAELLHRGLLAEGYIYPKADRAVRDLLRRRSRLVQQHTANLLAIQNLFARDRGHSLSANEVKRLTPETVVRLLPDPNQALAVQATLLTMRGLEAAIDLLEREALAQVRLPPSLPPAAQRQRHRPGAGLDHHAGDRPHRALCRRRALRLLLPLRRQRAAVQRQAQGPRQHQERQQVPRLGLPGSGQLRGALQRRHQPLLPAQAGQEQRRDRHQDRRPQAGPGLLPHAARGHRLRCRQSLRLNRIGVVAATSQKGLAQEPARPECGAAIAPHSAMED